MTVNQIKGFFSKFSEKLRAGDKGAVALFVPMVFLLTGCLFLTVVFVPRLFSTRAANAGGAEALSAGTTSLRYGYRLLPTVPSSAETQPESTTGLPPEAPIEVTIDKVVANDPEGKMPGREDMGPEIEVTPIQPNPSAPGLNGFHTVGGFRYYFQNSVPLAGGMYALNGGVRYRVNDYGAISSKMGIDISQWNGIINWDVAKNAGVEYAIIRCGYRGYGDAGNKRPDALFKTNFASAKAADVPVGIYFFSQATNAQEGRDEALAAIQLARECAEEFGGTVQYPIYIDSENSDNYPNGRADQISRQSRTEAVKAFCETVKLYGYTPGIYASASWFTDQLDFSQLSGYAIWVAHYTSNNQPGFSKNWGMWQYTAKMQITGLQTGIATVDANIAVVDYLNGSDMSQWGKDLDFFSHPEQVDVYLAAESAVAKAEEVCSRDTYEAALSKVNQLISVQSKNAFLARLKAVENQIPTLPPLEEPSDYSDATEPVL